MSRAQTKCSATKVAGACSSRLFIDRVYEEKFRKAVESMTAADVGTWLQLLEDGHIVRLRVQTKLGSFIDLEAEPLRRKAQRRG